MSVTGPSAGAPRSFCVYTTLVGGYEELNEQPIAQSSSIPFICLTDDPALTSNTWQIRRYPPHADEHDVIIFMFSGTVETLGQTVTRNGVIYYSAGEVHGLQNVGDEPAHYLVFEFHGARQGPSPLAPTSS
jgi:redox-sensitive bicupin YhaK (pirin superfamily)